MIISNPRSFINCFLFFTLMILLCGEFSCKKESGEETILFGHLKRKATGDGIANAEIALIRNPHTSFADTVGLGSSNSDGDYSVRIDPLLLSSSSCEVEVLPGNNFIPCHLLFVKGAITQCDADLQKFGYYQVHIKNVNPYDSSDVLQTYLWWPYQMQPTISVYHGVNTDTISQVIQSSPGYIGRYSWFAWHNNIQSSGVDSINIQEDDTAFVNIYY